MTNPKFRKGQWIIARWKESGDWDFAKFDSKCSGLQNGFHHDFFTSDFYRFGGDWVLENLSNERAPLDYRDTRYKFNWRKATHKEIKKFTSLLKIFGIQNV